MRLTGTALALIIAGCAHVLAAPACLADPSDAVPLPQVTASLSIVPVPGEPGRLVAAEPCYPLDCALGAAYASEDGGRSWAAVRGGPAGALWVTRGAADVIWSSQPGALPRRSADGGRTWRRAGRRALDVVIPLSRLRALATPAGDSSLLAPRDFRLCDRLPPYASAARELLRTDDGRRSWQRAIRPRPRRYVQAVAARAGRRSTVVVALGIVRMLGGPCHLALRGARIWISTDAGRSWRRIGRVPGAVGALAVDGPRVLVGTSDGAVRELRGRRPARVVARLHGPISQLVARSDGALIARAGGRLRLIDRGGAQPPPVGLPRWADAIALEGAHGIATAGGGAVRTSDGGLTFTDDVALPARPGAYGSASLAAPGRPAVGGRDGLAVLDGAAWREVGPAGTWLGLGTAARTATGLRLYASASRLAAVVPFAADVISLASRVVATEDAGATWRTVRLPPGSDGLAAVDPADADHLLASPATPRSARRYFLSHDGSRTWRPVDLPAVRGFGAFLAIRGDAIVVSLVDGGLWRSDDDGRTWGRHRATSCESFASRPVALVRVAGAIRTVAECAWLYTVPRETDDRVLALELDGRARSSADAGATWTALPVAHAIGLIPDPAGGAWAVTQAGIGATARIAHIDVR